VRLAHVRLDGTLALEEVGSGALADGTASYPPDEFIDRSDVPDGICAMPNVLISPNGSVLDQAAGVNHVPAPPTPARPPKNSGFAANFTRWVKSLPGSTPISFAPNTKRGKSAARFSVYSSATTLEEYRRLNGAPHFTTADLAFDLDRGMAKLPTGVWAQRLGAAWAGGSGAAA
jgi:hypothetical protein